MPADGSPAPGDASAPATIRDVLRKPDVARTLGSSVVARLPYGAMVLLTVLRVTDAGHSYGDAGLASAAYAISMALGSPVISRIIDRRGQTGMLLLTAVTGALATTALAVVPSGSPLAVFVLLAAVNGAAQPPLSGVMRALWDAMLTDERERHVGYAVQAGATEIVFTGGPLVIVGGIAGGFGPTAGLLASAALTALGTAVFAMSEPSRRWRPHADRVPDFIGPLRSRGVHTLMIVSAGAGGSFGAIEIGVTAFSREHHETALIGVLLAVWSVGSLVGSVLFARVRPARDPAKRLVLLLGAMAVGDGLLGLAPNAWALGAWLFVVGATIAPTFATTNATMGPVAPAGMMTEAFAFTIGAIMVGSTISAPIAGLLVDHVSAEAALSFGGAVPGVAALLVWLYRGTLAAAILPAAPPASLAGPRPLT
ncbi:MAG: MFS transporter [Solirubrobacteraceae bacterium]|nr:MFS transporter [Patulibacter sp.]